jgi:tRNA threonylcarbamoyladenosine biosynthesis protein TsaB
VTTPAPLILAIETSGPIGSAALLRGDATVAERRFEAGTRGGGELHPAVTALLAVEGGRAPDRVAVGIGPGSYTGARIGLVFAKTFAFGRGLPLVGVSALEAVALRVCPEGRAAAMMEAHPGHVYAALYACGGAGAPTVLRAPGLVARDAFLASLDAGDRVIELPPEQAWAVDVGRVAARRTAFEPDPGALEPLYLQPPAPERAARP